MLIIGYIDIDGRGVWVRRQRGTEHRRTGQSEVRRTYSIEMLLLFIAKIFYRHKALKNVGRRKSYSTVQYSTGTVPVCMSTKYPNMNTNPNHQPINQHHHRYQPEINEESIALGDINYD